MVNKGEGCPYQSRVVPFLSASDPSEKGMLKTTPWLKSRPLPSDPSLFLSETDTPSLTNAVFSPS